MLYRRSVILASSLLTLIGIGSCSFILPPDDKADGVFRCDNSDDCPPPKEDVHEAVCDWGEGQDEDTPKVCYYDYKSEQCNIDEEGVLAKEEGSWPDEKNDFSPEQMYKKALLDAYRADSGYVGCDDGGLGCSPDDGGCDGGLEEEDGTCIKPGEKWVAVQAESKHAGQDVADQHCRSFFCEEEFVCASVGTGSGHRCQPCEEGDEFGKGGCAKLYVRGAESSVYTDLGSCDSGKAEYGPTVDADDDDGGDGDGGF